MHRGYIKLYRAVMDNHLWGHKPFSYGQAWVHMLLVANHKEGTIWVNKTPIKVARGQLGWSQERLASEFGWNRQQVRTFLKHLKRDHMINQDVHGRMSIITIVNYEKYHGDNQIDNHPVTNPQPGGNQPVTTNKNDKNGKKEKKEYISPRLGEHENVKLTQVELDKLVKRTGKDKSLDLIERISGHIASKGDKYKSHYATALNWHRRDGSGTNTPQAKTVPPDQEAKRKALKDEQSVIYTRIETSKRTPESHPDYEMEKKARVRMNKRIDEIEALLLDMEG